MSDNTSDSDTDGGTDDETEPLESTTSTTESTNTRHPYTNDVLAVTLAGTLVVLAILYATGVATTTEIPRAVSDVLSLGTLAALAWAFGPEMIAEAAKAWNGGSDGGKQ